MERLKKILIHLLIIVIGLGTIFFLVEQISERWELSRQRDLERAKSQLRSSIRLAIERKIAEMMALTGWYQHSEQASREKMAQFVEVATKNESSFKFVMYVDDKLIVRGCSPERTDIGITGFDLKDDKYTHSLVREAETHGTAIVSHPLSNSQLGDCLFVLSPIFLGKDLGGFVVGVFDQADTIGEIIPAELRQGYDVSICDASGSLIAGTPDRDLRQGPDPPVGFHNSTSKWYLDVVPKRKSSHEFIFYLLPIWALGILLLAILNLFIHAMYSRRAELERLVAERTDELQTAYDTLEEIAITDHLTKLFNRRFFYQRFGEELSRAKRSKSPLSCLILDLDDFKLVNDRYGHLLGDQVLVETANILRRNTRKEDVAARYGGEEFILLMVDTDRERALAVGERIRKDVENAWFDRFANNPTPFRLTTSIGVTEFRADETGKVGTDDIIHQADVALYRAKHLGKNRVVAFSREEGMDERVPVRRRTEQDT